MKRGWPIWVFMISVLLALISCTKNDGSGVSETKPLPENEVRIDYVFLKKEVVDFKAYAGSPGGGIDITSTSSPQLFWNATKLKDGYYDNLAVQKDSIFELPYKYEKNNFRFKKSNDTIYQWNRYADSWQLYGHQKGDTIAHYMCFYSIQKSTPPLLFAENGHDDGMVNNERYFNNNPLFFKSISDILNTNDKVAWYNIKYVYVKKK
ncbi:hypothetical protein [Niabella aquatica]